MSAASLQVPLPPVKPHLIKRLLDYTFKLIPLRQKGFLHPSKGYWVMTPQEFNLILAHENKAVAQVIFEILLQTIGQPGDELCGRQQWTQISPRYFVRKGLMSKSQAEEGLCQALEKGYIVRRPYGRQKYEYSIRWKDLEYGTDVQMWKNPCLPLK